MPARRPRALPIRHPSGTKLTEQQAKGAAVFFQRCSLCHLAKTFGAGGSKFCCVASLGPDLSGRLQGCHAGSGESLQRDHSEWRPHLYARLEIRPDAGRNRRHHRLSENIGLIPKGGEDEKVQEFLLDGRAHRASLAGIAGAPSAFAQYASGGPKFRGTVKSPDGKPLEGVTVSVRGEGKTFVTTVFTNQQGVYVFPPLEKGLKYSLWAQAQGFQTARLDVECRKRRGPAGTGIAAQAAEEFREAIDRGRMDEQLPGEHSRGKAGEEDLCQQLQRLPCEPIHVAEQIRCRELGQDRQRHVAWFQRDPDEAQCRRNPDDRCV